MEKSKSLGDCMTGIANHAKKSEHEEFGEAVRRCTSLRSLPYGILTLSIRDRSEVCLMPSAVWLRPLLSLLTWWAWPTRPASAGSED